MGAATALSRVAFTGESETEHLWLRYYDLGKDAPVVHTLRTPIVACFVLCFLIGAEPLHLLALTAYLGVVLLQRRRRLAS